MKIQIPEWLYLPNILPKKPAMWAIAAFWFVNFILMWQHQPVVLIPKPAEVIDAYPALLKSGLLYNFKVSFSLFLEALAIAIPFSLSLSYLSKTALGYYPAHFVGTLRFLSMTGLPFIFQLTLGGGHTLKLAMLVFGITVFYTEGMMAVVNDIPKEKLDHARTLKMGEWHILYEVIILGTIDKAFDLLKQNSAMVWMMLTMVEGLSRAEGGVGIMLLNIERQFGMVSIFALQFSVLFAGIIIQLSFGFLQNIICRWRISK